MLKHSKPKVHSITRWSNAKSTKLSGGSFRKCHAYAILSPVPGYSDWIRPSHPKTPGQQQHLLTALERCPLFRGIDVEVTLAKITNMKTLPGLKMECWESTSKPANCAHGMCRRYQSPLAFNGIRISIVSWWDLPTNHKDLSNLVDAMEIICGLVLHAVKQRCTVKVVALKWPHDTASILSHYRGINQGQSIYTKGEDERKLVADSWRLNKNKSARIFKYCFLHAFQLIPSFSPVVWVLQLW